MDASPLPTGETRPAGDAGLPLLPPVLLGPPAILWLWLLPVLILLLLNLQGYWLVEGNMDAAERARAHWFGLAGLANLLAGAGVFVALRRRARAAETGAASGWWGLPAVLVQVAYLWLATSWEGGLLPRTVTAWIYPPQRFFYNQFAFAMVPLFWGLTRLACARPARGRRSTLLTSLALAVLAPVVLFGIVQAASLARSFWMIGPVALAILVVLLGVAMFVGIIRALALGLHGFGTWSATAERIAILIFALLLPAGGLLLNREIPFPNDFQAWEVYALTAVNAAVLMLASWLHERRPLISLGLLCATLPFTLYFFVVFLPFLPLSILAVVLMGAGFLVLTPTLLLILHLGLLNKARRGSRGRRLAVGLSSFLLLPGFFTVRGLADKAALNAALDHVYAAKIGDAPITYAGSRAGLRRALDSHRSYKNGIYYPLLSDYQAWLVFDHLVLPDDKLAELERAFFDREGTAFSKDPLAMNRRGVFGGGRGGVRERHRMPLTAGAVPRTVEVSKIETRLSGLDDATIVTLALTLENTGWENAEYAKSLPLPPGVFVSGFRLHIDGKPVAGRITEKKTALWVYSMIRDSERRDPGLLFYNAPDELELRVFPVVRGTAGVVEIDFLAPGRVDAGIASRGSTDPADVLRALGERLPPRLAKTDEGVVATGGVHGLALPAAKRAPFLHVIVDRSEGNGFDGDLAAALKALALRFPEGTRLRVTLANYETVELPEGSHALDALPLRGGFLADHALAQAIRRHRDAELDGPASGGPPARPVFVLLARTAAESRPAGLKLTQAWSDLAPALEIYSADAGGGWRALHETPPPEVPLLRLGASMRPLVAGRAARFARAEGGHVLEYWDMDTSAWRTVPGMEAASGGAAWLLAAGLALRQQDHDRGAAESAVDLKGLVRASRESGVMLASTSYIVVENTAQWRMLEQSEERKLDQNAALAFKEAPAPSWIWLAGAFGLWLLLRRGWRACSSRRISG